jgi:PAS domain S-box-containing protein
MSVMKRTRLDRGIIWMLIAAGGFLITLNVLLALFLNPRRWHNISLHSTIEATIGSIAILLSLFLLQQHKVYKDRHYYLWISCGLISMSILDGFHALLPGGASFIWLRSMSVAAGGFLFSLVWLSGRIVKPTLNNIIFAFVVIGAVIFGAASIVFEDILPVMQYGDDFSAAANIINFMGGVLFLAASAYFVVNRQAISASERKIFASLCFLLGLAGLFFLWSGPWSAGWWLWHIIRMAAFFSMLLYMVGTIRAVISEQPAGERPRPENGYIGALQSAIFKKGRINWILAILLYSIIIIPLLTLSFNDIRNSYSNLTRSIYLERSAEASIAAKVIEEKLTQLKDLAVSQVQRPSLVKYVGEGKWLEAEGIIKNVPKSFPFIEGIFICDTNGVLLAGVPGFRDIIGKSFAYRDWYKGVSKNWQPYVSGVYRRSNIPQHNVIALATPIKNETNEVLGILVLQVRSEQFGEWAKEISMAEKITVFIVDRSGKLLFHSGRKQQEDILDFSSVPTIKEALGGRDSGVTISYNPIDKEGRLAAYKTVRHFGWVVVVAQETQKAFAFRNKTLSGMALISFAAILLNTLFYSVIIRLFIRSKRMADQLRIASLYNRNLIESSIDPLVTIGPDGKITDVNKTTEEITGYSREELIGKDFSDYFTDPERAKAGYQKVFQEGSVRDYDLEIRHRDGHTTPVLYNATVYRDESGRVTGIFAAARDITDRKKSEDAIKHLNAQLKFRVKQVEEANKELEAFTYSVSHDLRAPLRAIAGFSRMMLEDYLVKLDDEGGRRLKIIEGNVGKMGDLIDDLLAFSRLGRQEKRIYALDMTELAKVAFDELKMSAPARQKIRCIIKPLPLAAGDASMIKQVFTNLLSNAIKFTRPREEALIEVGGSSADNENTYYVKDNGVGFDMRYADKLFGVFQRLHSQEEFEGTGVGLAIVQRVVHRHDGRAWAESKVGEGATFYFTLKKGGEDGDK